MLDGVLALLDSFSSNQSNARILRLYDDVTSLLRTEQALEQVTNSQWYGLSGQEIQHLSNNPAFKILATTIGWTRISPLRYLEIVLVFGKQRILNYPHRAHLCSYTDHA
jgi:hypothetical protein